MSEQPDPQANRCFICGYDNPNGLHEHHIVPQEYGGTDAPDNLTWLCASCHQAMHKLYDARFYQRLGVVAELDENSVLEMDLDGERVEPAQSLDREIPRNSDHVLFESEDVGERAARLHCGYCRATFGSDKHPNMAKHLQLNHGIEKPYESGSRYDPVTQTEFDADQLHHSTGLLGGDYDV